MFKGFIIINKFTVDASEKYRLNSDMVFGYCDVSPTFFRDQMFGSNKNKRAIKWLLRGEYLNLHILIQLKAFCMLVSYENKLLPCSLVALSLKDAYEIRIRTC